MGMRVIPNYDFDSQPKPDILVIPGGGVFKSSGPLNDPRTIKWIQESAKGAKYVLSVCTGAFLLAKAGLLDGIPATTNAGLLDELKVAAPKATIVQGKRFVDSGKIITSAGLSAGIDAALHIISLIDGKGWAQWIGLSIDYDWQPDSRYTRSNLAEMRLPLSLYDVFYDVAQPLSFEGGTDSWEEKWSLATTLSPSEMLEKLNKQWGIETKWSRQTANDPNNISSSLWQYAEEKDQVWSGMAHIEPAGEHGQLVLTLKIMRSGHLKARS